MKGKESTEEDNFEIMKQETASRPESSLDPNLGADQRVGDLGPVPAKFGLIIGSAMAAELGIQHSSDFLADS